MVNMVEAVVVLVVLVVMVLTHPKVEEQVEQVVMLDL
jgi:hypothetical protein